MQSPLPITDGPRNICCPKKRSYLPLMGRIDKLPFTRQEIVELHRNFWHPSADKLFNFLKVARPLETDYKTKEILKEIGGNCDTYERLTSGPG